MPPPQVPDKRHSGYSASGPPTVPDRKPGRYSVSSGPVLVPDRNAPAFGRSGFPTPGFVEMPTRNRYATAGPVVVLPGCSSQTRGFLPGPSMPFHHDYSPQPSFSHPVGYTENHLTYAALRDQLSKMAYAGQGGEVVVVQVEMAILPVGKRVPKVVGVSCDRR
jgi:hypothetical protein